MVRKPGTVTSPSSPAHTVNVEFGASKGAERHSELGAPLVAVVDQAVLATTEDGRPLRRPRLVVPGDVEGGRCVPDAVEPRVVRVER